MKKRTALVGKALAALLAAALLSVHALAAEEAPRAGGAVPMEDAVCGDPAYRVFDLAGDGEFPDTFSYDVPEGGVTALIFFNSGCGKSRALFQGLSVLTEDPRVSVTAVTQNDRAAAQAFADAYIRGRAARVYYGGGWQNPFDAYMDLTGENGGTAFVLLVAEEDGVKYIRWSAAGVSSARAVKAQADAILAGSGTETPEEPEKPEEPPSGVRDTVAGQPSYQVYGVDGSGPEPFGYDVPEGGAAALVFFKPDCGNCADLFQSLSVLTEDPRVSVTAVSIYGREETQGFLDRYLSVPLENVYYNENNNPAWAYARLHYGDPDMTRVSIGTAFVLLVAEEDGVKYIRWSGMSVRDAGTVKAQVDAILGALEPEEPEMPASAVLRDLKRAGGSISFEVQVANRSAGALSGRLYAAGYAEGRLTDLRSAALELPANGRANERFSLRGETAKLFYLDGAGLRPLMEAAA